jgi:hypothetical protein
VFGAALTMICLQKQVGREVRSLSSHIQTTLDA